MMFNDDIITQNGAPLFNDESSNSLSYEIDLLLKSDYDKEALDKYMPHIFIIILDRIFVNDIELLHKMNNKVFALSFTEYMTQYYRENPVYAMAFFRTKINKLLYDYTIQIPLDMKDVETETLYANLGDLYNRDILNRLSEKDIPEYLISYIPMVAYSSSKSAINIKRLNHMLIFFDYAEYGLTVQQIVDIYTNIFRHMTDLFITTMFDVYSDEDLEHISDNGSRTYARQGIALLEILNVMDLNSIKEVLKSYSTAFKYKESKDVRFSLKEISLRFGKIIQAINEISLEGYGII